jgi:hypothetical protein
VRISYEGKDMEGKSYKVERGSSRLDVGGRGGGHWGIAKELEVRVGKEGFLFTYPAWRVLARFICSPQPIRRRLESLS